MKPLQTCRNLGAFRLALLASAAALSCAPTFAADDSSYLYLGGSLGRSRANIDEQRINNQLIGAGLTPSGMTKDEKDAAYKVFLGYQFNRYVAVEGGYFDLGKFYFHSTTVPSGRLDGQIGLRGMNLDLVGTLPLSDRWSLLGRAGAARTQARDQFVGSGAVVVLDPNPKHTDTQLHYGGGLQYALSRNFMLRAELDNTRVNDAVGNHGNVSTLTAGFVWTFAKAPAVVPRQVQAPAYVAPPPPPPPVVMAPPPPPPPAAPPLPPKRVTYSADATFDFDTSAVRPEGKAELDKLATDLQGTRFETINVEGHADRIGTPEYNQTLSEQRAQAAKDYLVNAGKVDPSKISAVGKGETQPATKAEDCKGNAKTAKLITCLQPDRRVVVEVQGTKAP